MAIPFFEACQPWRIVRQSSRTYAAVPMAHFGEHLRAAIRQGRAGGQVCYTLAHLLDESISVIKGDVYVLGDGHWLV